MPKQHKAVAKKLTGKSGKKRRTAPDPSPIKIVTDIFMGQVDLSETQAISVALIRNELQQEFVAVRRMYRSKSSDNWKSQDKIWLPFKNMYEICNVLINAFSEGSKLGWGNNYQSTALVYTLVKNERSLDKKKQELPPLKLTPLNTQGRLFD